jgi:hypothetical protein
MNLTKLFNLGLLTHAEMRRDVSLQPHQLNAIRKLDSTSDKVGFSKGEDLGIIYDR